MMSASWSLGPAALELCVSAEALRDQSIEAWYGEDPGARVQGDLRWFGIPDERWRELAQLPDDDPELADLFRAEHTAAARLLGLARQHLAIGTVGHIGAPDLTFELTVDGVRLTSTLARPVARAGGALVALSPCAFEIHVRLCAWNARRSATRNEQLVFVADLRDYLEHATSLLGDAAVPLGFTFDPHLAAFRAHRPHKLALGWQPQANGAVFDLQLDEVAVDGTRTPIDVKQLDPDSPLIALSATEHVLLDRDSEIVARAARTQRNKLRKHVERHFASPASVLPEGVSLDHVDLSAYGPRVIGFAPILRAERWVDIKSSGTAWYQRDDASPAAFLHLEIAQPGGGVEALELATPEDAAQAVAALEQALAKDPPDVVTIGGKRVAPSQALADRIRDDLAAFEAPPEARKPAAPRSAALAAVITEDVTPVAAPDDGCVGVPWKLLDPLLANCALKPHQRDGVAWLWQTYQRHAPGVLLADDMGLGKTLQIAAFLALVRAAEWPAELPPTLIVCPVILLENWQAELRRFFQPEVFESLIVLHGAGLAQRKHGQSLDLSDVRTAHYVLTNYETLQAHQQALLTLDWNVVVLDEAQAIKNPETYRARAARGLKRRFGVCSTGTPVENRLSDLWSLYDFLSPGQPFTTLGAFTKDYEDDLPAGIPAVRTALRYPGESSSLLRRTKSEALDLPPKTVEIHRVAMTAEQAELERGIVRRGERNGGVLKILQDLQALYQHPRLLVPEGERGALAVERALVESPKLALCVDILRGVRAAGEKALVFTLWTDMQDLLVEVFERELGLRKVRVINGDPKNRSRALRTIDEFSAMAGFHVLVLSPLAAGTGLTITAANHVIHYGRWWNPAKEDQATDRAYRIGQTRPVRVHYPLLTAPGDATTGFDVKLHELVERKRGMSREFLAPQPAEMVTMADLTELQEVE